MVIQHERNTVPELAISPSFFFEITSELGLNKFYPCEIEEQNESYLAGEGPMFEPPIPPLEYRVVADSNGFTYSNGNWQTTKE